MPFTYGDPWDEAVGLPFDIATVSAPTRPRYGRGEIAPGCRVLRKEREGTHAAVPCRCDSARRVHNEPPDTGLDIDGGRLSGTGSTSSIENLRSKELAVLGLDGSDTGSRLSVVRDSQEVASKHRGVVTRILELAERRSRARRHCS